MTRKISTGLKGKTEVFRMMALGESVNLPLLLVGVPGVGKTAVAIDYTRAEITDSEGNTYKTDEDQIFILETDTGTRSNEIKGNPDIKTLAETNEFKWSVPVANAKTIVINEIDKTSSGVRNALLGIMNERRVFRGAERFKCDWSLFVATCNAIPEDEIGVSPLWDRFILKYEVGRITQDELMSYFRQGGKSSVNEFVLNVPNEEEIIAKIGEIPMGKLEKFIALTYEECSDRTLTYVPAIAAAVSLIWECSIDQALIKTAALLTNRSIASNLTKEILSPAVKEVMNDISRLSIIRDKKEYEREFSKVEQKITNYVNSGKISDSEVGDLAKAIEDILESEEVPANG